MATMIGRRVEYRGSVEELWGRYEVVEEVAGPEVRFHLATLEGEIVLRGVRRASFTPVPASGEHVVLGAELRAQIVQGEFARRWTHGEWIEEVVAGIEGLPARVSELIARRRPVEAEYALLCAEQFVGCISYGQYAERVQALTVAGLDESWMP
jgi:hypothetical protein